MIYSPLFEMLGKAVKELCQWFFVTCLFATREMQAEVRLFFDSGRCSFKNFEWLNLTRLKEAYPGRWKWVFADFVGAYLKLIMLGVLVCLIGMRAGQL